jgi:hypothetical protein
MEDTFKKTNDLGDEALADVKADFLELGRNQIG